MSRYTNGKGYGDVWHNHKQGERRNKRGSLPVHIVERNAKKEAKQ